jgi:ABC-type transport system involved in multi-copper enzyme maturation permease subunit
MSAQELLARAQKWSKAQPWQLYGSQIAILIRNELRRSLFTRRRIWVYFLAAMPLLGLFLRNTFDHDAFQERYLEFATQLIAMLIQVYYVRIGVFFACMGIVTWLFRGEMVQRTLHYQFLSPIRREVLVVGKFLGGTIITTAIFEIAVAACFYLGYVRFGAAARSYIFDGPGLGQLGAYLLVTALACVGYGAVFLALSLLFKNPIVPGLVLLGWETVSPVFPAWAQRLSVAFYLKHLCPVSVPVDGPMALFTVVAEPVAPWLAVLGLLCLALAVLVLSCFLIHRLEISYTTE